MWLSLHIISLASTSREFLRRDLHVKFCGIPFHIIFKQNKEFDIPVWLVTETRRRQSFFSQIYKLAM